MAKRLIQLNQNQKLLQDDFLLIDNENYDESKKIAIKDIKVSDFNTDGFYTQEEIQTELDKKVDKEEGKVLSSNDFTDEEKQKLAEIEAGAQVNLPVDLEYDPESENPQSGKAVNQAISEIKDNIEQTVETIIKTDENVKNAITETTKEVISEDIEPRLKKAEESIEVLEEQMSLYNWSPIE